MVDPNKDETKWGYDSTHDVISTTTPKGETTTIKRDSHGNPEVIERPAPGGKTQATHYKYDSHGDVESVEDPLKRVWTYEYNSHGDRSGETDPEGDKRTFEYDEDSNETATVSPKGSKEPAKYTTKIERDEQERPKTITDPLAHATNYTYDADGDLETLTEANGHTTSYEYDADNEPIKVKEPNGDSTETEYDGEGHVVKQTDGNKHATKYVRNILGQVAEVIDPLGRTTVKEYDAAGNLVKLTDAAKRTTTYTYDPANRLTEVSYSDGKTPTVKYEYDADGDRTKMEDGTGTSSYEYDQLDRLTESTDGHGGTVKYEYDLANQQTKLTYPNGKAVTRVYDEAGRLEKVTDWLANTTKFTYDADSNLTKTTFPTGTSNIDTYTYNRSDQLTKVQDKKATELLASLAYTLETNGNVKTETQKGLPGEEKTTYKYDENNRLTKAGSTEYKYDAANNPTKTGASTNTYDEADQLKESTGVTYTYDELGERTKHTPTSGPATTYGYDQAGNLTSVERPKEGETSEIKDAYGYNGDGLRASETVGTTTSYVSWDLSGGLPLILNDSSNSYIYGPGALPVEQIDSEGNAVYVHHDQQGTTRLLTGSTGTVEGAYTYDAYGNQTGHTGAATTPLGYDGQYTSSDAALIYLRARIYDPPTAQFVTRDPLTEVTGEPYLYSSADPTGIVDATGLSGIFGTGIGPDVGPDINWASAGRALVTRNAGFWDGVTGGLTAKLRGFLGWNGGLETCSAEYQEANGIGQLDLSLEAGALFGGGTSGAIVELPLRGGAIDFGRLIAPFAGGAVGGVVQTFVAGHTPTLTTAAKGAVGGLAGELTTGFFASRSAAGVSGAVNAAFSLVW